MQDHEVVVIGSGHNGLVAAAYLAKAGLDVRVFEANEKIGGGLFTEEFEDNPDFLRNNHAINFLNMRQSPVHKDLRLERYGAQLIDPVVKTSLPLSDGRAVLLYEDPNMTKQSIAEFSERDAERYEELYDKWNRMAYRFQRPEWYNPPRSREERREMFSDSELGSEYFELCERAPSDVIQEEFENPHIQALFTEVVKQTGAHPFEEGIDGSLVRGFNGWHNLSISRGGSNSYAQAIGNCFEAAGGEISTGREVTSIDVEDGKATGITLADGTSVEADVVVSNVHYPQTYLDLVGRGSLPESFISEIEDEYELMEGPLFGVHLALDERPKFTSEAFNPDMGRTLKYIIGGETLDALHEFKEVIDGQMIPEEPLMSCGALSVLDPSQAPEGKHTAYMWAYAPWDPEEKGPDYWDEIKGDYLQICIDQFAKYAPNVDEDNIVDAYAYSPRDIPRTHMNMIRGSRSGGNYTPDQLMDHRPDYSGPIEGLYMSGSPTHPGGSITGAPGYNCAGVVVEDLGIEKWWNPPKVDI
jgi:phytoene dehydrogenase-like protein